MLNWTKQFSILAFMDSNSYPDPYGRYEFLSAVGCMCEMNSLEEAEGVFAAQPDWMFGHLNYDHKNTLEPKLHSGKPALKGYKEVSFFVPETVCRMERGGLSFVIETVHDPDQIFAAILREKIPEYTNLPKVQFELRVGRDAYIETVQKLRAHIREGDCYEINFCNEGHAIAEIAEPLGLFRVLNSLSPAPFASYYRNGDHHLVCASPERYLCKAGDRLISQPIKGTSARSADPQIDSCLRTDLRNSEKEQAENVMIVDLVRNDLARCCVPGSVQVEELFGIYSYPSVHQMMSTVSGQIGEGQSLLHPVCCSFPMGSMTGAPKFKVMELIEQYEPVRRELYSGTVGYVSPAGDFDFNVVIRSLFYNAATHYLCFQSGGAITYDSDPAAEWDEMQLKASAMANVFR